MNETYGDIQEYRITVHIIEEDTVFNIVYNSSEGTELVAGPVHPYYTYNISIQAVTVEPGPPITIIVRTPEAGRLYVNISYLIHVIYLGFLICVAPSGEPTSFEASVINETAIFLSWEPPLRESRNGIIRQYMIELETAELQESITITSMETNITITNLHPYTLYECKVAAETISVGPSSIVQVRTLQAGY